MNQQPLFVIVILHFVEKALVKVWCMAAVLEEDMCLCLYFKCWNFGKTSSCLYYITPILFGFSSQVKLCLCLIV
jgi:hypothetical protein